MIVVGSKLWIACYSSIACMDLHTLQIVSFGKEDGFPAMPVVKGARFFYDSTGQQLYISFSTAVVRFNPYDLLQRKPAPRVFIENIVINGKESNFLPGERFTTSWRDNEIMLTIGSINFSDGHSQGYAYRLLKDSSTPWQELGNQPSFSISNLSPGTYKIQVKLSSLTNHWSPQIKEITIVVLPPFWQEVWFVLIVTALIAILIYLLVSWRTGVARKTEMEKTHIQKLKADDYKNQFELEQISNYFSSSLAGKKTAEEVLWDVASNLIGRMNYADCMIYLWNEDKTKMVQKAAFGPKGKPEFISANIFDVVPGQGVVGYVMETRQPVLIPDTRQDNRYRMDEMFRLSEICVPIIHNGELIGIIDSEHHELNYFKERDLNILNTIATLIGNKLEQLESERSLEANRQELAGINEQLAEARLAALQAQMNPHFVFNALNSIKRMILDGDNETASRYLSKFAQMIRMTLNHSKDTFVTLDENIQYLETYLKMEQLRFDESFSYSIVTGKNIDTEETAIPSLMIQPLVENAIWHGLLPSMENKKIIIGFTQEQNKITCTIEDNGIGIRASERMKEVNRSLHHSVGLENLQKRIRIINEKYNTDCSLEITDLKEAGKNGSGTRVILRFNVINI
jgi:putative methionine-R-sulfoxide reductase with GAF domain